MVLLNDEGSITTLLERNGRIKELKTKDIP